MKARPTLLPAAALRAVAQLMAEQEAEHNGARWRERDVGHHLDAAGRHLLADQAGEHDDPASGHPHLVHAAARLLMAVAVEAADDERMHA